MDGWSTTPLADVCHIFTDGDWIEKKDQSPSGIRLIQTGNVGVGRFKNRPAKARYISTDTFDDLKCTEILAGDCLVSRLPDPVGRSCIIPDTGEKMITAVDCTIIRFKRDTVLPEFFRYYSQSKPYLDSVDGDCTGATRRRISRKNLGKVLIPLPPILEQECIVAILDEAFAAIATATTNTEKNLANARELFKSYSHDAFTNQASAWPQRSLGDVCENLDKRRVPITKAKRKPGKVPYYGASGVVDHVADHLFDEDLLLVSEDGANLLARTYPIAFSVSGRSWVNNHAHVLRFEIGEHQRFAEHYLNSISLNPFVSGMAQPKLNQAKLNSIPIPWPENAVDVVKLVRAIESVNSCSSALITQYSQKLAHLDELKQSILHQAFIGKLAADCSLLRVGA